MITQEMICKIGEEITLKLNYGEVKSIVKTVLDVVIGEKIKDWEGEIARHLDSDGDPEYPYDRNNMSEYDADKLVLEVLKNLTL